MVKEYKFLVCVRCFTYNQSQFIEKTLDGFVCQETSFPFVILLVDDASTDNNQEIISSYILENFDIEEGDSECQVNSSIADVICANHKRNANCHIVAMFLKKNHYSLGQNNKKIDYLSSWRQLSKYEAICEGDDYWIDTLKLQSQVEIMESDDKVGLCYTRTKYLYDQSGDFLYNWGGPNVSFKDLLIANTIPTLTVLYRVDHISRYIKEIVPSSRSWKMGDYPMWLWLAYHYKVYFIDKVTSVYRVLNESASHSKDVEKKLGFILSSIDIQEFFANKYGVETGVDYSKLRIQTKMYNYALYRKWHLFTDSWKKLLKYSKLNVLCIFPYKYMLFFIFPRLRGKYLIH